MLLAKKVCAKVVRSRLRPCQQGDAQGRMLSGHPVLGRKVGIQKAEAGRDRCRKVL